MQSSNEGRKLVFCDILQFINEKNQGGLRLRRRLGSDFEQSLQVMLEVGIVGEARLRIEIKADFDVLIFHFQRLRKTGQSSQRSLSQSFCALVTRKAQ